MNVELTPLELLAISPDRSGETGAECEILLPDYCPNVLRILQATAHPTVNATHRTGGRLTVEGSVEFRVLYLPEDGSGIRTVSQQAPFSCGIEVNCGEEADLQIRASGKSCTARALSSQKIYVRSSVRICVRINERKEILPPAIPADCERKTGTGSAAKLLCTGQKPLRISDEFEMEPGKTAAYILQTSVTCRETEQKPLADRLIVKGDLILDLLCSAPDHRIFSFRKIFPVSQILDLPGLSPQTVCCVEFETVSANLIPREETAEGTQSVGYDVELRVSARAYEEAPAQWTEDAYSVKNQLECVRETVSTEKFLPIEESGTIRETAEIGTCTELLWAEVSPELRSVSFREESGSTVCEGVWECRFLFLDGESVPAAALREIPFALEISSGDCKNPLRNDTVLTLTDLSWSVTDGTHVEIRGNYQWSGLIFYRQTAGIVTSVSEKEARGKDDGTLIFYYASKGESAWEIAKEHACPYGELLRENGLERDEIEENMMLTIVCC